MEIDENNVLQIKGIGVTISTSETLPAYDQQIRHAMRLGVREEIVELGQQLLGAGVANPAWAANAIDARCWW